MRSHHEKFEAVAGAFDPVDWVYPEAEEMGIETQ